MWMLNGSGGITSLLDIATKSKIKVDVIKKACNLLLIAGLLSNGKTPREEAIVSGKKALEVVSIISN